MTIISSLLILNNEMEIRKILINIGLGLDGEERPWNGERKKGVTRPFYAFYLCVREESDLCCDPTVSIQALRVSVRSAQLNQERGRGKQ